MRHQYHWEDNRQATNGGILLQNIPLIKDWYPGCIKTPITQRLKKKQTSIFKRMSIRFELDKSGQWAHEKVVNISSQCKLKLQHDTTIQAQKWLKLKTITMFNIGEDAKQLQLYY